MPPCRPNVPFPALLDWLVIVPWNKSNEIKTSPAEEVSRRPLGWEDQDRFRNLAVLQLGRPEGSILSSSARRLWARLAS